MLLRYLPERVVNMWLSLADYVFVEAARCITIDMKNATFIVPSPTVIFWLGGIILASLFLRVGRNPDIP